MTTTSVTGARLGLVYGYSDGEDGWGAATDAALQLLDTIMMPSVINRTTTAPPSSPALGDAYVIGASPTGAWSGKANQLAVWVAANSTTNAWLYITPKTGFRVFDVSATGFFYYNGTAWTAEIPSAGAVPYDVGSYAPGVTVANQVMLRFTCTRALTFAAGLATSKATADTAATASTVFNIATAPAATPNTFTNVGTITFAASGSTGTFALASGFTTAAGDVIRVTGPSTPDAALAGVSLTLVGSR